MEITLEQVERLREKANVSYGQAKQALEYSGGNLLDALIYLEEQGVIPRPEEAYYSTRSETPPPPPPQASAPVEQPQAKKGHKGGTRSLLQKIRRLLLDNELEIWRRGKPVTALPVLIVILLVVFPFYVTLPALILGLFLGFRYQISGPDLEDDTINGVMDSMADTAAGVGRQVMDELRTQHEKYQKRKNRPDGQDRGDQGE